MRFIIEGVIKEITYLNEDNGVVEFIIEVSENCKFLVALTSRTQLKSEININNIIGKSYRIGCRLFTRTRINSKGDYIYLNTIYAGEMEEIKIEK